MTLNEIEQRLDALQAEKDKLTQELERLKAEEQSKEVKPWRAEKKVGYCFVRDIGEIFSTPETGRESDYDRYKIGNYYRTRELAEQDAKELALRGRVRQLRDALCEGYQFRCNESNWEICFDSEYNIYRVGECVVRRFIGVVYFDTREHAQQACDILNAEREKESGE